MENGWYEVGGVGDKNILWGLDTIWGWDGFPFWEAIFGSVIGAKSAPALAILGNSPDDIVRGAHVSKTAKRGAAWIVVGQGWASPRFP